MHGIGGVRGDEAVTLASIATAVAVRSAIPLALLVTIVLFLLVQDRIDRKDPKLALAPVFAEPDLPFVNQAMARGPDGSLSLPASGPS